METTTFLGRDLREALDRVKQALGDEAMILATREVKQGLFGRPGVEVIAHSPEKANVLATLAATAPSAPWTEEPAPRNDVDNRLRPLEAEVRRLRAQLVSLVAPSGVKSRSGAAVKPDSSLESHLITLGLDAARATRWAKVLVAEQRDVIMRLEKLVFDSIEVGEGIGEEGARLVMCVGPSGAGKTTTLAKWAAKAQLEQDKRVAIVTLDAFRAGAVAQARRYADLIGCPLAVAEDMATLQVALDKHADKDLVFVDTAGRDPSAQEELGAISSVLRARDKRAEIHLALPAMFGPRSMRAVLDTYKKLGANRLCFTKVDEVIDWAPLALLGATAELPMSYWTTGQRIPDDIERITAQGFAERTLAALTRSLFGANIQVEEQFL